MIPLHAQGDNVNSLNSDSCEGSSHLSSGLVKFDVETVFQKLVVRQNGWRNWQETRKVVPKGAVDAPVLIAVKNKDYWLLSRLRGDVENGYHAWHSTNMIDWKRYGPVSSYDNRWVTSAEHVNGEFYIYFDKPNDEDPHLIIDSNLRDGLQGQEVGMVLNDPSHGSDSAVFRDINGSFHLIFEDWSPINASLNSWDSPLAGHAISEDGISGFKIQERAAIDQRSAPTGEFGQYSHPHSSEPYEYEIHDGEQDAYGDFSMIKVGETYYLFSDYDPKEVGEAMRIGRWQTNSLNSEFVWDGSIGKGFHPDPTIGFAEKKFYLLVQRYHSDFISDGPWVDGVEVRVGVDVDRDGGIDNWTDFRKISELYAQRPGFTKVVDVSPAVYEYDAPLSGYGYEFEVRISCVDGLRPEIISVVAELR